MRDWEYDIDETRIQQQNNNYAPHMKSGLILGSKCGNWKQELDINDNCQWEGEEYYHDRYVYKIKSLIFPIMSERKGSLQLVSNTSAKFFVPQPQHTQAHNSQDQSKMQKYRGSFSNIDQNNYYSISRSMKPESHPTKEAERALVQKSQNVPERTSGFSSYRNSLQESLLNKLRKLGYVSNASSIQNSPNKKKKGQKDHKRGISNVEQQAKVEKFSFNKGLFDYKHVIGRGGFGKVWKVELKRNKKIYAMKEMSKALIIAKKSVPSVINEKKLLASLKNNFLVNMVQAFQDRETLYLVMDYLPGGDLRHHIAKKRKFSEEEAKFIIACIFIGLEYLHNKNIIHRDIKPENLVLDEKGYVRITDLGVARAFRPNNAADTSGTPGYMAPEVLCRQNHTYSVDHFALGIIAYELMLKKRPYYGRNRKEIRDEILARQIQVKKHEIPDDWSLEAADFINRLIQRKPTNRLGFNSSGEIRNHPWLRQYPLEKLERKEFGSPYMAIISQEQKIFDESKFCSENTQTRELIMQNQVLLRDPEVQQLFEGYESVQP